VEEIVVIGYWQRANNLIAGDKEGLVKKYRMLYQLFQQMFKKSNALSLRKFQLVYSKEPFHDRYWLGENDLLHVSNSINGAFESGELNISKESELNRFKIRPRIERRYQTGEKHDLIENAQR
jgi:hypothetical protein